MLEQILKYSILILCLGNAFAWDGDELEVFDVVDEVNQNFYTLMGVSRDADGTAIKKAFRNLSRILHPDKSDAPDAEIQFRQLVAVYDILKDPNKRKCYDNVLDNGLPDWKQAVYYYRRVRKMGLREMFVILFVIITIGQYLVGWASYFERKLTVEELMNAKSKKSQKKQKKGKEMAPTLEEFDYILVKPSLKDTLPCQLPRLFWFLFVTAPPLLYSTVTDYWHERQLRKLEELQQRDESEEEVEVYQRAPRKRKTFVLPELKDDPSVNQSKPKKPSKPSGPPVLSGGLWTDDDLEDLAKLVKKFPVGTTERWEKIGEAMRRPASEVAHMAHKLKDSVLKNLAQKGGRDQDGSEGEECDNEEAVVEEPRKVKTKGGKIGEVGENNIGFWSQVQQKAFEAALAKFPKGAANDRWIKISKCVPGKTKEDCMIRYKYLVEIVKKKKEDESQPDCDSNLNNDINGEQASEDLPINSSSTQKTESIT